MENKDASNTYLSEDTIKKRGIAFLKSYYRFRPRGSSGTIAKIDMRADGGIIADGFLKFDKEDGSPFTVTFEATSWHTRDEVYFKTQDNLLNWDSIALSLIITTLIVLWMEQINFLDFYDQGFGMGFLISWMLFLSLIIIFKLSLRYLQRYRYIYAIEQFKQYFATEQWICISEDVFASSRDQRLAELKKQCISYGVGLLIMRHNEDVLPVITPAREIKGQKKKKILNFVDLPAWSNELKKRLLNSPQDFNKQTNRFRRSYVKQQVIGATFLCFLGFILFDKYTRKMHVYQEAEEIIATRQLENPNRVPEPNAYKVDSSFLNQFSKQSNYQEAKDRSLANTMMDWEKKKKEEEKQRRLSAFQEAKPAEVSKTSTKVPLDACNIWQAIPEGSVLLIKGTGPFLSEREASDQYRFTKRRYGRAGLVPSKCLPNGGTEGFYVYISKPMRNPDRALEILDSLNVDIPTDDRISIISL